MTAKSTNWSIDRVDSKHQISSHKSIRSKAKIPNSSHKPRPSTAKVRRKKTDIDSPQQISNFSSNK